MTVRKHAQPLSVPIDGETRLYGIMGKPVSHSLSPAMHNAAFRKLALNGIYIPFEVTDVAGALHGFRALAVRGVSVTVPYKQQVIAHLDSIDSMARKIGAVNTLVLHDRLIHGLNTDWLGAVKALEMHLELSGKTALVIGAGGAARAIGFGLLEKGAAVMLANRTHSRGKSLARQLDCPCYRLADIGKTAADVLINATSVGMSPKISESPVPAGRLKNFPIVMDIVYSPVQTQLLQQAQRAGCRIIAGTEMLLYQGAAQFEAWTGKKAPIGVMRRALVDGLAQTGRERSRS